MKKERKEEKERIYLDYAASTPLDERVLASMEPFWRDVYANPFSRHGDGERARDALEKARKEIARGVGVKGEVNEYNLVITSGGTEANSLALMGALRMINEKQDRLKGAGVLVSAIEHASVLEVGEWVAAEGGTFEKVPVSARGVIRRDDVLNKLTPSTRLLSLQLVNSEIGTIQPVREIVRAVRAYEKEHDMRIIIHTDASQAPLWISVDVDHLGVDLATFDAHKMYGPKGVGALYVKDRSLVSPILTGSEGKYLRAGTPPVPLVAGFAEAMRIANEERDTYVPKVRDLRDQFIEKMVENFPDARINGSLSERVANNISVSFSGHNHDFLQVNLDADGISVATRSACLEAGGEGSAVLSAMRQGADEESALRITLGRETTQSNLECVLRSLTKHVG